MHFGIFDWIDRGPTPLRQTYEDRLRLIEAADDAGFFCYHLAEHHATPLGMAPSPGIFLAALAQRTHRIRFGPLVYLLPLYNPLRLIEEICMIDHLSNGRLELGVGRGVSPYELGYHGVDAERSREIFQEALAVLIAGFTNDRLTFEGTHYHYDNVPVELHPLQQPYPPLWYATHNIESVPWAATNGMNMVGLGPAASLRRNVDLYWELWQTHRDDPGRLNAHVKEPKAGINRQVFVAATDDEAHRIARAAHADWFQNFIKLWHDHGDTRHDGNRNWDAAIQNETILVGSPDTVRDQLARLFDASGCNYLICSFAWGSLSHEQSLRSLRLFAEEVMPAFAGSSAIAIAARSEPGVSGR
jgi:alkanesulfonate monooxygenase SsuD/methylene tetrahydromethanopterin reductase-like flavin-dependent oxidoreductase (luciferase family)